MDRKALLIEFKNQVETIINSGYHREAGLSLDEFEKLLKPLTDLIYLSTFKIDYDTGKLPFIIVVSNKLVSIEFSMKKVIKDGKHGVIKLYPHEPKDFTSLDSVLIPAKEIYLMLDIDRGRENLNIPPNETYKIIKQEARSPLTIDEGVAIVTHHPDFLTKNNCFSLLASRNESDKRVPAIWINSKKEPNLGWCWDGNPHTWLGSASCKNRLG